MTQRDWCKISLNFFQLQVLKKNKKNNPNDPFMSTLCCGWALIRYLQLSMHSCKHPCSHCQPPILLHMVAVSMETTKSLCKTKPAGHARHTSNTERERERERESTNKPGVKTSPLCLASYPGPHITVFPLEGLVTVVCACA